MSKEIRAYHCRQVKLLTRLVKKETNNRVRWIMQSRLNSHQSALDLGKRVAV